MSGPYTISRDAHGFADAIERDGQVVLHLRVGTVRNEEHVADVLEDLNAGAEFRAALDWINKRKEAKP